jgi:DNA-binding transcriptional ArsR family regulator
MASKVKKPNIIDAILHPQRLEIVRMLGVHGPQSVRELGERLPQIAQATLYRHVKMLQAAGAVICDQTRTPQRGAPETIYALVEETTVSLQLRGAQRSSESMRRYFTAVQAALLSAFERTLAEGAIPRLQFAVRSSVVYLNAAELREVRGIFARLKRFEAKCNGRRRPFSLSFALFPERSARATRDLTPDEEQYRPDPRAHKCVP